MIKKFKDINVTKTNFLSDFLKLIPITKQISIDEKVVTNCYDYLTLNDVNTLINLLKSHYRYRYCYEDEIFEQLKAVNDYALPKFLSKINVMVNSQFYDFFENYSYTETSNASSNETVDSNLKRTENETLDSNLNRTENETLDSNLNRTENETLDSNLNRTENETLDSNLKRADTPTTVSGDLVNQFTTEQVKDVRDRNTTEQVENVSDRNTTEQVENVSDRNTSSSLEVTRTEKGSVIDKLMQITSFNEEISKYIKEYIKEFSSIFSVVDLDVLEATIT